MTYRKILRDLFGFGRGEDGPDAPPGGAADAAGERPHAAALARKRRELFDERLRAFAVPPQEAAATEPAVVPPPDAEAAEPATGPPPPDAGRTEPAAPPAQLVAGRLRMIALADIRARVGDRWPRLETKIHGQIRRVLERRLAESDVYQELGEDGYVVLFTGLSPEEAAFKAQVIAREIATRLIGDVPEVAGFELRTSVHAFSPDDLGQSPDLATLAAAFEGKDDEAAASAAMAGAAMAGAAGAGAAGAGPPRASAPGGPSGPPEPPCAPDVVRLAYLPMWSRRGKAIAAYQCVPLRRAAGGHAGRGPLEERLYPAAPGEEDPELDHLILRSVAGEIGAMQEDGRSALVVAPVAWETLASRRRRREYLDLCREPPQGVTRQLCFAVFGVPAGLWQTAIVARCAPLAPFGRFLFAHVGSDLSRPENFANTPVQALLFDADGFDPEDQARRRAVEGFVRQTHAHRLAVGALWVDSRAGAAALRRAGVDLLAGSAIAALVDQPGAAYRLHPAA